MPFGTFYHHLCIIFLQGSHCNQMHWIMKYWLPELEHKLHGTRYVLFSSVFFSVNSAPHSPLSITPHPTHHQHTQTHTHPSTQVWTTQPPPTLPFQLASHFFISLFLILSSSSSHACESPPLVKSNPEHLLSLPLSLCCTECPGPAHHLTTTP